MCFITRIEQRTVTVQSSKIFPVHSAKLLMSVVLRPKQEKRKWNPAVRDYTSSLVISDLTKTKKEIFCTKYSIY